MRFFQGDFKKPEGLVDAGGYLKASNTDAGDFFGSSVALTADTLAVSAAEESSSATGVGGSQADNNAIDSGAVYIFH